VKGFTSILYGTRVTTRTANASYAAAKFRADGILAGGIAASDYDARDVCQGP
jgi:hypothetical protein